MSKHPPPPPGNEIFIRRCLELAGLGMGRTSPNPMVGAVVVHSGKVIGSGFHQQFGGPHAEVNAITEAHIRHGENLSGATLFVSLEPCNHYGKTPPCTDAILSSGIRQVIIGTKDPNPLVAGKGIKALEEGGCEVTTGILAAECAHLNRRFFSLHRKKRPYVILKWAKTADGIMGDETRRLIISSDATHRLTHKWRSEEDAILIGFNTALRDDPALTVRNWKGKNPLVIVVDKNVLLPESLRVFNSHERVLILNGQRDEKIRNRIYRKVDFLNFQENAMSALAEEGILSVLIEGGSKTLQGFISSGVWDEARIIRGTSSAGNGVREPVIQGEHVDSFSCGTDSISIIHNQNVKRD